MALSLDHYQAWAQAQIIGRGPDSIQAQTRHFEKCLEILSFCSVKIIGSTPKDQIFRARTITTVLCERAQIGLFVIFESTARTASYRRKEQWLVHSTVFF